MENSINKMNGRMAESKSEKRVANLDIEVPSLPSIERNALAAAFRGGDALHKVTSLLTEEAFEDERNQILFRVLQDFLDRDMETELTTAHTLLRMRGREELCSHATDVFTESSPTRNAQNYCLLLLEQQSKRKLLHAAVEALEGIEDPTTDAFDLQRGIERAVMDAYPDAKGFGPQRVAGEGQTVIDGYRRAAETQGITGLNTGYPGVNEYTHGWQNQKSYILAAASSMGKTALAVNFARKMLFRPDGGDPYRVAYFTAENPAVDIAEKILAAETGVNLDKAKEGKLYEKDYKRLQAKSEALDEMPLWMQFNSRLKLESVAAHIRRLVRFEGLQIAFLDNLNKMHADRERGWNRERELAHMSAEIKGLAEECEIPIVTLAQVTRSRAESGEKPTINHIRGSGMIENDADVVTILYRPKYYGIDHSDELDRKTDNLAELMFAKNRGGKRNVSAFLTYAEEQQRFEDGMPKVMWGSGGKSAPF